MRCGIFLLALLGLCVCLGCGSEPGLEGLVEVTGLITYQGSPIEGATVAFVPESEGRAASGLTDADGKFKLTTLKPGDGARPGRYKVTVSKVENLGPESQITAQEMSDMITKGKMPPPMGPTSPQGAAGSSGSGKKGGKKYHVPETYGNPDTSGLAAEVVESGSNDFEFALK